MTTRVAINGFGRIGRQTLRAILERHPAELEVVALNYLAGQRARYVALEEWHPKQRARWEKDGSYVLEVPYSSEGELVMDILRFGPDVEVVGPPALREATQDRLRKAAALY